jgi:hypothetical protein
MIDVLGAVAWAVCITLLVLTLACQRPAPRQLRSLKYRDVAALLPSWTFFAPNPGVTDTRLLWRDLLPDATASAWHEVLPPRSSLLRAVWNPQKRQAKLITDAGGIVARMGSEDPDNMGVLVSMPYLLILHRVCSEPASPMTLARQFLVVQTDRDGEFAPRVLSKWHALDEANRGNARAEAPMNGRRGGGW